MKFLNVAIIIFLAITLTPKIESKTKVERIKEVEDVIYNSFNNPYTSGGSVRTFLLGESNRYKELERERERLEELDRVSQASYRQQTEQTDSYTGQGSDIKIVGKDTFRNCVLFSKYKTGITGTLGYGGYKAINTQEPQVGAIASEEIYTKKGLVRHASVVIAVYDDSIRVIESNYLRNFITERTIKKSNILGYII